jgi:methylthioribose-1-phosphate isomerase
VGGGTGFAALDLLAEQVRDGTLLAPLWPVGDGVALIDQTKLPFDQAIVTITTAAEMAAAIATMQIRGSGAIGCAGALGAYLAVRQAPTDGERWDALVAPLLAARPTAITLRLAVAEVLGSVRQSGDPLTTAAHAAAAFVERQLSIERAIGRHGAAIIPDGGTVLTHCHSGALAGAGYGGRALSVIRAAVEAGKQVRVIAQETRPYLQGARITAWELQRLGIPVTLITDGMSGAVIAAGMADCCVVGSDRLAINGDLANKTGTYLVALAAREHGTPFYTATTRYTIDPACASGREIPIEMRPAQEILEFNGRPITVAGVEAYYPAFDITPAKLLSGIITEDGLYRAPFEAPLRALSQRARAGEQDKAALEAADAESVEVRG